MGFTDTGGLAVRPELLEAEAGALNAAALAVAPGSQRVRASAAGAGAALPGWRTGAALEECASAWAGCFADLSASLDAHADRLRATSRNYRDADASAAARLRSVALP